MVFHHFSNILFGIVVKDWVVSYFLVFNRHLIQDWDNAKDITKRSVCLYVCVTLWQLVYMYLFWFWGKHIMRKALALHTQKEIGISLHQKQRAPSKWKEMFEAPVFDRVLDNINNLFLSFLVQFDFQLWARLKFSVQSFSSELDVISPCEYHNSAPKNNATWTDPYANVIQTSAQFMERCLMGLLRGTPFVPLLEVLSRLTSLQLPPYLTLLFTHPYFRVGWRRVGMEAWYLNLPKCSWSGTLLLWGVRTSVGGQGLRWRGSDKLWNVKDQFLPHVAALGEHWEHGSSCQPESRLKWARLLPSRPVTTHL